MSSKLFWRSWPLQIRALYQFLLLLALISFSFFLFALFSGQSLTIGWEKFAYFQEIPVVLDNISINTTDLAVEAKNLIILQNFEASPQQVNVFANYLFLILISLSVVVLLSIATYLPKIWFFISIGLWLIILSILRLELLAPAVNSYIPLAVAGGSTALLAYYFNVFKKSASLIVRLVAFFLVFVVIAILIEFTSTHSNPFLYLASNAIIPMFILSVVFIFLISHEIVASFIYILTSNPNRESNNHVHFLVITLIYLINVVLLYLYHIGKIDWKIWYINPFILLIVSFILGIWGYKQREEQFQHIFSFAPLGAFFYLSLGTIAFITIALFLGTANDPALEVVNQAIIYGHLGFGLVFLLYIVSNFSAPLSNGIQVNKILYKPTQMPYFIYRLAGLIAVFAFVIISNWEVPFLYTYGAYFNQQGNLAKVQNEPFLQHGYYQQSRVYAYLNHHANYGLATYFDKRNEKGKASAYYINAVERTPSPYAYINLSRVYQSSDRYFDALFTLQKGVKAVPNGQLYNNLGLHYSKTDIIDSAFYFLDKSAEYSDTKDVAVANIEALAAAHDLSTFLDSMDLELNNEDVIALNNKIVRYNQQKRFFGEVPGMVFQSDSNNFYAAGMAYNYLLNTTFKSDTTGIQNTLNAGGRYLNSVHGEKIEYALAISEYYNHRVQDAFRRLNILANRSFGVAEYFYTLGQWALEQNAPDQAAKFFRLGNMASGEMNPLHPISLVMDRQITEARSVIEQYSADSIAMKKASTMATPNKNGPDIEKFFYIKHHLSSGDTATFYEVVSSITNPNFKAEAILSYSKKLFNEDNTDAAIKVFSKLENLNISNKSLFEDIQMYELQLFAASGRLSEMANLINDNNIDFSYDRFPQKVFYSGMLNAASGDSISALKNFRWIALNHPFMEMEMVVATNYIKELSNDRFEVYNLLLNAIEVNPKSIKLLKAYALEAARLGLDQYAENALEDLKSIMDPKSYNDFQNTYQEVLSSRFE